MIVPGRGRRDDDVTDSHRRALTIDGCGGAFTHKHKTKRRLGMAGAGAD